MVFFEPNGSDIKKFVNYILTKKNQIIFSKLSINKNINKASNISFLYCFVSFFLTKKKSFPTISAPTKKINILK